MKDKNVFDMIEENCIYEELEINFDGFFSEEELNEINLDNEKIKNMTYEKIGKYNIKKYKSRKIVNLIASIVIIILIGTPITLAFVKELYKYDKSSGTIIKSDFELYILKEPITKKVGDGEITVKSFTVNPNEESIEIGEIAKNISGFENIKEDIIVDGKNITNSTYSNVGSAWEQGKYIPFKYDNHKDFKYVISLMDSNKKITKVEFNIDLEKATSIEEYNKQLPKDIKNNVVISAITKEDKNYLYTELMAIPNVENFNFSVNYYGNHINEHKGSSIFLVDANGIKVEGEYYLENNKYNEFRFDISNLQKPFTIEINKINVSSENTKGQQVNLPKLKYGESINLNQVINIEDKNNIITKESSSVVIKQVSRKEVEGCDSYVLDIEYPENKDASIKIDYLDILSNLSWFGFGKFDFSSSSQEKVNGDLYSRVIIYLSNKDDEEYKGKEKLQDIGFRMSASSYTIKGLWKLKLK